MKTMSNTSGGYGMLQGADGQGDSRVFSISAIVAVLVVSSVVAFKMAAPEIKAAVLDRLPIVSQFMQAQTAASTPHASTPVQGFMGGEH